MVLSLVACSEHYRLRGRRHFGYAVNRDPDNMRFNVNKVGVTLEGGAIVGVV